MGLFNTAAVADIVNPAPAAAPRGNQRQQGDRPQAQVYLNAGITVEMPNPETGEVEPVFISLPFGIGIDTMDEMEIRGNNQQWINMVQAKNYILAALKKAGEGLKPGESMPITELQLELRRAGKPQQPAAGENPLLAAMQGKLSIVK